MGGTSIKETIGFMDFAPVKDLTQNETKKISEALSKVSEEEFKYRYKYAGIKEKTSRRKRSSSGKFEQDYQEAKLVRSLQLTDTAWE